MAHRPRPLALPLAAALAAGLSVTSASAADLDLTAPGLVAPSFRGDANTTWFGWDVFDASDTASASGFGKILDDAVPDVGSYAGPDARIVQDAGLGYGHRSGSNNYYSGFGAGDVAGDTITVPTNGTVGGAGYTTIVLQLFALGGGQPGTGGGPNALTGMTFDDVLGVSPTVYYTTDTTAAGPNTGNGHYLVAYELPGNAATYDVHFASATSSRSIDVIAVDTLFAATPGAFNDNVLVPEPAALAPAALALLAWRRRRR